MSVIKIKCALRRFANLLQLGDSTVHTHVLGDKSRNVLLTKQNLMSYLLGDGTV